MRLTAAKKPWQRDNPATEHRRLTPAQIKSAKARAKRNGRKYPNLIDNMWAAARAKAKAKAQDL